MNALPATLPDTSLKDRHRFALLANSWTIYANGNATQSAGAYLRTDLLEQ
jgi:hypothetical protein